MTTQNNQNDIEMPPLNISELYQKIFDNINFQSPNELMLELNNIKQNSDIAIEEFKNVLVEFANILVNISDNHLMKRYKTEILSTIEKHPKNIIDTFIIHGYVENNGTYRKEIIEGNEDFFLNKSYNEYTSDSSIVDNIFQFKSFWKKLDDDNKFTIKTFLLTLCFYSDKRFVMFNKYREIKQIYGETYKDIFSLFDDYI